MGIFDFLTGDGGSSTTTQDTSTSANQPNWFDKVQSGLFGNINDPNGVLSDGQKKTLQQNSMMNLAANLLQQGGYQPTRQTFGQGFGQAIGKTTQAMNDQVNNIYDQNIKAAQANNLKVDSASKSMGLAMQLQQINFQRAGMGMPPLAMSDLLNGSLGSSSGSTSPVAGLSKVPSARSAMTPAQASQNGYDPSDLSPQTLAMVQAGVYKGSPAQYQALGSQYALWGNKELAGHYMDLANKGVDGFQSNGGAWNTPNQPINDKSLPYIQGSEYAKASGSGAGSTPYQIAVEQSKPQNVGPGSYNYVPGGSVPSMPNVGGFAVGGGANRPPMQGQTMPPQGPVGAPGPSVPPPNQPSPQGPQGNPGPSVPPPNQPSPQGVPNGPVPSPNDPMSQGPTGPVQGGNIQRVGSGVFNNNVPMDLQKVAIDNDQKALADSQTRADAAQQGIADAKLIQDLAKKTSTGFGQDELNEIASAAKRFGMTDQQIAQLTGTNPTASQEMKKVFFQQALENMKATTQGREAGFMQQAFMNANPNVEMTPEAVTGMTNKLIVGNQRTIDRNNTLQQAYQSNYNNALQGKPYSPINMSANNFDMINPPTQYVKASQAISGDSSAWQGLKGNQVDQVYNHIPSGSSYIGPDGKMRVKQ